MRAMLMPFGTPGNIEPFLAIAQLLKQRDWEAICAFPEQFETLAMELAVPFEGFHKRFLQMVEGAQGQIILGGKGSLLLKLKALIWMIRESKSVQEIMVRQQHDLIQKHQPDLVIPHIFDQHYWNDLIMERGLGPKGIPLKRLKLKSLTEKIEELYFRGDFKTNSERLAEELRKEDLKDYLYDLLIEGQ